MQNENIRKFKIEIWFSGLPDKFKLGEVYIYAENQDHALELASANTSYEVSGVDETQWQVHEPVKQYA